LKDHVPSEDALVVTKLLNAGAIILGKTNVPELLNDIQAIGPLFPQTKNPWHLDYIPGGTTCGAAGVSALFSPLEIGSSINGSVEIPASYCGLFSYKPSLSLMSMKGHFPPLPDQNRIPFEMTSPGFIGRSIDDFKTILDVFTSSRETQDPTVVPVALNKTYAEQKTSNRDFKLAWSSMPQYPLDKNIDATLQAVVEQLSSEGFKMVEKDLPYIDTNNKEQSKKSLDELYQLSGELFMEHFVMAGAAFGFRTTTRLSGMWSQDNWIKGMGVGASADLYMLGTAMAKKNKHMTVMDKYLEEFDALICPVTFSPPHKICKSGTPVQVNDVNGVTHTIDYYANSIGITSLMNLAGLPTLVIPAGQTPSEDRDNTPRDVLPIGIMIVTRRWQDAELLHIGDKISRVLNVKVQTPPGYSDN
jgi:amidase